MDFYEEHHSEAKQISILSIAVNVALIAFKVVAGLLSGSLAILADASHSLADIFSTVAILISLSLTEFPGREKKNTFIRLASSIGFALILVGIAVFLAIQAIAPLASGEYMLSDAPGKLALIAALVSVAIKEGLFWYTMHGANDTGLSELKADAWHHRTDAISSVLVAAALIGASTGLVALDNAATLGLCLFILKEAISLVLPYFVPEETAPKKEK